MALVDRLADEKASLCSVPFRMMPPTFPVCAAIPEAVAPGEAITITAAGLFEDEQAKVLLGDDMLLVAETDGDDDLTAKGVIPNRADPGLRLLTVATVGTALTADCSLNVLGSCDLNWDGRVDHHDIRRISIAKEHYDRGACGADVDGDGAVTDADLGHCLRRCTEATCR